MKLLIILSVIAACYAEKLDRTYLPPESAATAGGSPGSLTAPSSGSGLTNTPFGQTSGAVFGQSSGLAFGQEPGQTRPQLGTNQPIQAGIGQYTQQQYNQAGASPETDVSLFNQASVGLNQAATYNNQAQGPSQTFGGPVNGPPEDSFGNQVQGSAYSGEIQPERARASIDRNAEILRYDNQNDGETFAYSFETSNGIFAEESGTATNGVQAQGGFAYTGDDGQQYRITYTADENGYQPQGDHLPTPPPIPDEILKSLEENARAAAAGTQEGAYNPDEDVEPQQYSGAYSEQGQLGQTIPELRPNQGRPSKYNTDISPIGIDRSGEQKFQYQGTESQYSSPILSTGLQGSQADLGNPDVQYGTSDVTSSSSGGLSKLVSTLSSSPNTKLQGIASQGIQSSASRYDIPSAVPSNTATTYGPGFASQSAKSPAFQTDTAILSPTGSVMAEAQEVSQYSGYQYNTPGSSTGLERLRPQTSIGKNPASPYKTPNLPISGPSRPESEAFLPQGSQLGDSQYSRPSLNELGLVAKRPESDSLSRLTGQRGQNSGYNYNTPAGSSISGFKRPDSQNYSSLGGQSPSTAYNRADLTSSNLVKPSENQDFLPQSSQMSQYDATLSSTLGLTRPKEQYNSGLTGSAIQRPVGQKQNDGYQYNRPQNVFSGPNQKDFGFTRPSGTGSGSISTSPFKQVATEQLQGPGISNLNQGLVPGFSGNTYSPSGSASGSAQTPNRFIYSKPQRPTNQGYDSGSPNSFDSKSGSRLPTSEQYQPVSQTSITTRPSIPLPGNRPTFQYQTGQIIGTNSPITSSAPYQYKPPSSGSQTQFGTRPSTAFGYSVQTKPDQTAPQNGLGPSGYVKPGEVVSQAGFGPVGQDRPTQVGSSSGFRPAKQDRPGQTSFQPSVRPSGQERPKENFAGSRQPPSFNSEEGYKY